MRKLFVSLILMATVCSSFSAEYVDVFEAGKDGYAFFRIPAIIKIPEGPLLAFCEGRKWNRNDSGDIDLVMKSSQDGGKTWGALSVIWNDNDNVCGNPAPVWDAIAKKVVLVCTWNNGHDLSPQIRTYNSLDTRRVFVLESSDYGKTWSKPREITDAVKKPTRGWYATGPCHAIQLSKSGRIVVPCNHSENTIKHSHLIYSDDHGKTWHLGAVQSEVGGDESTIAELPNGSIVQNMRMYNYRDEHPCRAYLTSKDKGMSYSGNMVFAEELIEPVCQGSILSVTRPNGKIGKLLLFSNPSSKKRRENLVLKMSKDNGASWQVHSTICPGKAAYSDLVQVNSETIGVLFETGEYSCYEKITFCTTVLY